MNKIINYDIGNGPVYFRLEVVNEVQFIGYLSLSKKVMVTLPSSKLNHELDHSFFTVTGDFAVEIKRKLYLSEMIVNDIIPTAVISREHFQEALDTVHRIVSEKMLSYDNAALQDPSFNPDLLIDNILNNK